MPALHTEEEIDFQAPSMKLTKDKLLKLSSMIFLLDFLEFSEMMNTGIWYQAAY